MINLTLNLKHTLSRSLTAFPDFTNPKTQEYWTHWIKDFVEKLPVDGLWIDMNEPASFCDGNCGSTNLNSNGDNIKQLVFNGNDDVIQYAFNHSAEFDPRNPKYRINNFGSELHLNTKSAPVDALHYNNQLHYDLHNLYGHSESIMTYNSVKEVIPNKRPFVLSRSTFAGSGAFVGHWSGDNWSTWEHLFLSIPAMLNFQLFGIPLIGADICGFVQSTTEELCARWMELGAFYPFSRNHNAIDNRPQEPYLWHTVAEASRRALHVRYALLPYYYTLFYQAHKFGSTVVRPFFFEFPQDKSAVGYDRQFLVGPAILVSPVLDEGARHVDAYFPQGVWYDWYTHRLAANISQLGGGEWKRLPAPLEHIPVHIRGGHILPLHKPQMTVQQMREENYDLLIALDSSQRAQGDLYVDDGISNDVGDSQLSYIHFSCEPSSGGHRVLLSGIFNYQPDGMLDQVFVLGVVQKPLAVFLNEQPLPADRWQYDQMKEVLTIHRIEEPFSEALTFHWRY